MLKSRNYRDYRERTFDHEITLINNVTNYDELGNPIQTEDRLTVLCGIHSVGRNEFYSASNQGMKPSKTFVIHAFEYNGSSRVEYEGERYRVIRTYEGDDGELELTCEKVIADD